MTRRRSRGCLSTCFSMPIRRRRRRLPSISDDGRLLGRLGKGGVRFSFILKRLLGRRARAYFRGIGAQGGWDEASAQSLVQIRDQVVGILNADRNANKR